MQPTTFVSKDYRLYLNGSRLYATNNKKVAKMMYNKYARMDCKLVLATPDSAIVRKTNLILNYGIDPYYTI